MVKNSASDKTRYGADELFCFRDHMDDIRSSMRYPARDYGEQTECYGMSHKDRAPSIHRRAVAEYDRAWEAYLETEPGTKEAREALDYFLSLPTC